MLDVPVTSLLKRIKEGDQAAEEALFNAAYQELVIIARSYLKRERPGHTLDTRAVVHEVYLRLFGNADISWQDRRHFFVLAARTMRRFLVDYARAAHAEKRGGRAEPLALSSVKALPETASGLLGENAQLLLSIRHVLDSLERQDPTMARIIYLRFFSGMTVSETAEILGLSPRSVNREWKAARAFLFSRLEELFPPTASDVETTAGSRAM